MMRLCGARIRTKSLAEPPGAEQAAIEEFSRDAQGRRAGVG